MNDRANTLSFPFQQPALNQAPPPQLAKESSLPPSPTLSHKNFLLPRKAPNTYLFSSSSSRRSRPPSRATLPLPVKPPHPTSSFGLVTQTCQGQIRATRYHLRRVRMALDVQEYQIQTDHIRRVRISKVANRCLPRRRVQESQVEYMKSQQDSGESTRAGRTNNTPLDERIFGFVSSASTRPSMANHLLPS
jgi:hypothetical protein